MKDIFAFWGCGKGLLKSPQPHNRIIAGTLVGCSCLLIPLQSLGQMTFMLFTSLSWVALASMPGKMLFRCAIASVILFFPFLLLGPWMTVDPYAISPIKDRFVQAGCITLRSTCMLFISASTIASLTMQDVHRGLVALPIPRSFIALIVQFTIQTMLLAEETTRIIGMLRLRGATGVRGIRVLFSFPIVWMVRMLFRAERSAAAMSVRGYGIGSAAKKSSGDLTFADKTALIAASLIFVLSAIIRMRSLL